MDIEKEGDEEEELQDPMEIKSCPYCGCNCVHCRHVALVGKKVMIVDTDGKRKRPDQKGVMGDYICCVHHGCGREFQLIWDDSKIEPVEVYAKHISEQRGIPPELDEMLREVLDKLSGYLSGTPLGELGNFDEFKSHMNRLRESVEKRMDDKDTERKKDEPVH